ncbi:MAG: hypothetical protein ACETWM_01995 [Candidatus Lokiarchaeia archaeon]
MKIAFFEIEEWEKDILSKELEGHSIAFFKEPLNPQTVDKAKDYEVVSVFIFSDVNREVIRKMPKLKLIVKRSTTFENIDVDECRKNKITVYNAPTYDSNSLT